MSMEERQHETEVDNTTNNSMSIFGRLRPNESLIAGYRERKATIDRELMNKEDEELAKAMQQEEDRQSHEKWGGTSFEMSLVKNNKENSNTNIPRNKELAKDHTQPSNSSNSINNNNNNNNTQDVGPTIPNPFNTLLFNGYSSAQRPREPRSPAPKSPSGSTSQASTPYNPPRPQIATTPITDDRATQQSNRNPLTPPSPRLDLGLGEGLTDEQFAWMLQMQEAAHMNLLLEENEARNIAQEGLFAPAPRNFLNFLRQDPRNEGDSDGEGEDDYYTDTDDDDDPYDVDNMTYEEILALGDRIGTVSKGMSKAQVVKKSKEHVYRSESCAKDKICSVCQEDFEIGVNLRTLSCNHSYHIACIDQWLTMQSKCPVCNVSIKDQ